MCVRFKGGKIRLCDVPQLLPVLVSASPWACALYGELEGSQSINSHLVRQESVSVVFCASLMQDRCLGVARHLVHLIRQVTEPWDWEQSEVISLLLGMTDSAIPQGSMCIKP